MTRAEPAAETRWSIDRAGTLAALGRGRGPIPDELVPILGAWHPRLGRMASVDPAGARILCRLVAGLAARGTSVEGVLAHLPEQVSPLGFLASEPTPIYRE